jgi:hypothetical protein
MDADHSKKVKVGRHFVFASALVVAPGDWAARKDGANDEATISSARALDETQRRFIWTSWCESRIFHRELGLLLS